MRFKVNNLRQSFMVYWQAEPFPDSTDKTPYYSGTYLLTPESTLQYYEDDNKTIKKQKLPAKKELDKICAALCNEKWNKKGPAVLKAITMTGKIFFRDGDTKPEYDGFPGTFFISARSKVRPTYFDGQRQEITEEMGMLYSGCYVNVTFEAYPYTKGNNGLGCRMRGVQFVKGGEAFGGGGPPADDSEFDEIEDTGEEEAEESDDPLMG